MAQDRKPIVNFKVVEPAKPATAIDPELLDDDGRPIPGAFLARQRILAELNQERNVDGSRYRLTEPGSPAHDAVLRHMGYLIRLHAKSPDAVCRLIKELRSDPGHLDKPKLRAV
ncbi:MAG: hypothetical protein R3F54_14410 [Alphaproteobacteria bacterium]